MAQRQTPAEPGRYDKVGPPPFLAIRHLLAQDGRQANLAHPPALQHALPLQKCRSRNDQHVIASALAAGFEQKRYIQHREPHTMGARASKKPPFLGGNHRVQNSLELSKRCGVREDPLAEESSIDPAGPGLDPGKHAGNGAHTFAGGREQTMDRLIGIE